MGTVLFFFFKGFSAAGGGGGGIVGTVFRSAIIKAACLLLALTAPAWGQTLPIFTPEWHARIQELKAAQHPWIGRALAASTYRGDPDGEVVLLHIKAAITGEEADYRAAIEAFTPSITGPVRYYYTHTGLVLPVMYDALEGHLTADERTAWRAGLERHAAHVLSKAGWDGTAPVTQLDDSDLLLGHEGLVRLTDCVLGTKLCDLKGEPWMGCSHAEMKAAVQKLIAAMEGGAGVVGSGYNRNDDATLLFSAWLDGWKTYPEAKALLPQVADFYCRLHTADGKDVLRFGDDAAPMGELSLTNRWPLYAGLIGMGGDPDGKLLNRLASLPDNWVFQPAGHFALWLFDPRKLPATPKPVVPQGLHVTKAGVVTFGNGDLAMLVHCPANTGFHHQFDSWNVQIYKNGWLLDAVRAYLPQNKFQNGSLTYGMACMDDRKVIEAVEIPGGCRIVLETKGPFFVRGYAPLLPPSFVDSHRLTLELTDGQLRAVAEFKGRDPRTQANADRLGKLDQPALQLTWHARPGFPVTKDGQKLAWKALSGDTLTLDAGDGTPTTEVISGIDPGEVGLNDQGGTLVRVSKDAPGPEIDLRLENRLTWGEPTPPPPPNADVPVKGVIRGKQLIIELP
jgi:hypothetical protein